MYDLDTIASYVIKKLRELKGNQRLDITNIRNGETLAIAISNSKKLDMSDERWHGGGDTVTAGTNITIATVDGKKVISSTGGGGTGTVTSVSVTTANGVSGTVATATTTPAISLALGAITPTSVAASGTVTGSNLSGTNTGDNATNSQYSSLAASKQDTLVSGTNIKTINSTSLLGSGNIAISASPAGSNGDLQINASSSFGTIGGLRLDQTGNSRGTAALDIQSHRSGVTQVASGTNSTALGSDNIAGSLGSVAIGYTNTTTINNSLAAEVAIGYSNTAVDASGSGNAVAIGTQNNATNVTTAAIGNSTSATASNASAVGNNTHATNANTSAFGYNLTVSGGYSAAFGGGGNSGSTTSTSGVTDIYAGGNFSAGTRFRFTNDGSLGLAVTDFGSGDHVLALHDVGTPPGSNPATGGFIYCEGGALKYRGSSGTITTLASA